MSNPLTPYTVPSFRGGVNDFAASVGGMREDESLEIHNGVLDGVGRITLRRGAIVTDTLLDATSTEIDHVLWVGPWQNGMAAVGFSVSDAKTWFFSTTSQDGESFVVAPAAYATPLYTGATIPVIVAQEIQAPDGNRLYFCDANQNYNLKYVSGAIGAETITEPTEDFGEGSGAKPLTPNYVAEFNYHLFISGFENFTEHTAGRGAEIVRFSQPGLIQSTPPEGAPATAWWDTDLEPVGRPGEPIKFMGKAGGGLVIVKENNLHYWWGFDSETWGQRHISAQFGGENEQHAIANGWLYYMSNQGPVRTNGRETQFIGEKIREFVQTVDAPGLTVIVHNPIKFQVGFGFVEANDSTQYASRWKVWSYLSESWTEATYFESYNSRLYVRSGGPVGTSTLPTPEDAPSGLAVSTLLADATCLAVNTLTWTNGDTAPGTQTYIYRLQQGTAPIDGDWTGATEYDTVESGVSTYSDPGLPTATQYWYQIRHRRNNVFSNWNGDTASPSTTDVTVTTPSAPAAPSAPTGFTATDSSLCNGAASTCPSTQPTGTVTWRVTLSWTNNHGGITNERFARAEIWGKKDVGGSYELIKNVSTYDFVNTQTYATQSTNLVIDSTSLGYPEYNYFKIRIALWKVSEDCNRYSTYTSEDGPVIDTNPCTCASIPV